MTTITYLKTPNPTAGKWFVAVTNPNCHRRAELELYSLGLRTFVPKLRKWVSHARTRKAVERPLLGRYLFVELDCAEPQFGAVKGVNGVEGFVSVCGAPVAVPSHYVESFRMRYMAGEWDLVTQEPVPDGAGGIRVNPLYPIGARVRIVEGEFNDLLATITARKSGKLHCKLTGTNRYAHVRDHGVRAA